MESASNICQDCGFMKVGYHNCNMEIASKLNLDQKLTYSKTKKAEFDLKHLGEVIA
jgi:hypothetical protein